MTESWDDRGEEEGEEHGDLPIRDDGPLVCDAGSDSRGNLWGTFVIALGDVSSRAEEVKGIMRMK